MGGIELGIAVQEVILAVVAVDVTHADLLPQVMLVAAAAVDHFAEDALLDHVQQRHLFLVVAAVLQQHQRDAGSFAHMHQLPAFLQAGRAAYLHRGGDAVLHRVDGDAGVSLPAAEDEHRLDVRAAGHVLVAAGALGTDALLVFDGVLGLLHAVFIHVANHDNFHVRHGHQAADLFLAAVAQTDHACADRPACIAKLHIRHLTCTS